MNVVREDRIHACAAFPGPDGWVLKRTERVSVYQTGRFGAFMGALADIAVIAKWEIKRTLAQMSRDTLPLAVIL